MKLNLSPLIKRRLNNFRENRRGYYSFILFIFVLFLSTVAELIFNDKPIIVSYNNSLYFPIFKKYPETIFNGDFETEADYRDPYIKNKIESSGWILWPPVKYSYQTTNFFLNDPAPTPPSSENLLGTDDQGRDVLARVVYGFRVSVYFGLALTIISAVIGVIAGAVQGYLGGWVDLLMQRFIEIWSSLPTLFLIIILTSFVTPNIWWLMAVMLIFSWMSLVGVVRAECLKSRNMDYVRAAKALGVKKSVILFRHILPNSLVATISMLPFVLNGSITALTALDFLGFGLPPGSASLGELLAQGKANLNAPWLGITGFVVVAMMLSLLIFIGEAVRDAFDPRK